MSRRRKSSFGLRCLQGIATPAVLAAVALVIAELCHVVSGLVAR